VWREELFRRKLVRDGDDSPAMCSAVWPPSFAAEMSAPLMKYVTPKMSEVARSLQFTNGVPPAEQQPDHMVSPPPHRMHESSRAPLAALFVDVRP
jgi:hypothetical protein